MTEPESPGDSAPRPAALIVGAVAVLALFWTLGIVFRGNYVLDLGKLVFPAPSYASFLMTFGIFGTVATCLLAWGIAQYASAEQRVDDFARDWQRASDTRWVTVAALLAGVFAFSIRLLVLQGARISDDEAAYRFMAELLASGRLHASSPPMKEFFDNAFMINDGRLYAKYLVGWPALLAPALALGLEGAANPIMFGLTVPPLYFVLKAEVGIGWARAGVLLAITAPMLLFGAATLLSHTSCMCVLAWAWYFALRARDPQAKTRDHAIFAALLALACAIRPNAGVGIGAALGIYWLAGLRALPGPRRVRPVLVLSAVAAAGVCALGAVNFAQTGHPAIFAYQQIVSYEADSGHAFTSLASEYEHLQFADPLRALATAATGWLRLSFALYGWSIGLLPALLAVGARGASLAWLAAGCFTLVHLPATDPGIDTFGPVHFFELALPVTVLCTVGFARASAALSALPFAASRSAAGSALVALTLVAWLGYVPARALTLSRLTEDLLEPERTVEQAGLHDAVVFTPRPWAAMCRAKPSRHFAFFRPNNDPDLKNEVLWVNTLSLEKNRRLMRHFPERRGYVLARFIDCSMAVVPLEEADALFRSPTAPAQAPDQSAAP